MGKVFKKGNRDQLADRLILRELRLEKGEQVSNLPKPLGRGCLNRPLHDFSHENVWKYLTFLIKLVFCKQLSEVGTATRN